MTCFTKKLKAEDNNNISIMFYKELLNQYSSTSNYNICVNTNDFINLSTQEKLSDESIQEIIDGVPDDHIKFVQQDEEIDQYKLIIKFLNYDIESLAFRTYLYNTRITEESLDLQTHWYSSDGISEIRTYEASYKNDVWEIKVINMGAA